MSESKLDDSFDRRRNDRDWKEHLNHQLVTILTTQRTQHEALADLKEQVEDMHEFLRGGLNGSDPVETRLRDLERSAQENKVILKGGPLGDGGLIKLFSEIAGGRVERVERRGQNVSLIVSLAAALVTVSGLTIDHWAAIKNTFEPSNYAEQIKTDIKVARRHHKHKAPVQLKIETEETNGESAGPE